MNPAETIRSGANRAQSAASASSQAGRSGKSLTRRPRAVQPRDPVPVGADGHDPGAETVVRRGVEQRLEVAARPRHQHDQP
jgi:hypothetical protein